MHASIVHWAFIFLPFVKSSSDTGNIQNITAKFFSFLPYVSPFFSAYFYFFYSKQVFPFFSLQMLCRSHTTHAPALTALCCKSVELAGNSVKLLSAIRDVDAPLGPQSLWIRTYGHAHTIMVVLTFHYWFFVYLTVQLEKNFPTKLTALYKESNEFFFLTSFLCCTVSCVFKVPASNSSIFRYLLLSFFSFLLCPLSFFTSIPFIHITSLSFLTAHLFVSCSVAV